MSQRSHYRILMFAPVFAPFANPEAIVNSKLALAFLDAGWKIDIIIRRLDVVSNYDYGSEWSEPWRPLKNAVHEPTYEIGGGIRRLIEALRDSFHMRHPIIGCRWAAHALDLAIRLHKQNHYQIILSRSLPDFGHLPALAFFKKTGLPWVANWNDAFGAKNPPPAGKGVHANIGFFHERFLREVARNATWHTFPSDRMRLYICKYLGNGAAEKVVLSLILQVRHVRQVYEIKMRCLPFAMPVIYIPTGILKFFSVA